MKFGNYQQIELGYNYRMNDIQAALGLSQMSRINDYINIRHEIAKRYDDELSSLPIKNSLPTKGVLTRVIIYIQYVF